MSEVKLKLPPDRVEELYKCAQCGYCNAVCPTYGQILWESFSPRGRIFILKNLKRIKDPSAYPAFANRILQCTLCMACETVCPSSMKIVETWRKVREELFRRQLFPKELYSYASRLKNTKNVLGMPSVASWLTRREDLKRFVNKEAEVGYFVGCLASYLPQLQHTPTSLVAILEKANVSFTLLGNEWCCGTPLLQLGDTTGAREFAEHNVREYEKLGVQRVVASCAGCYRALKVEYPRVLGENLPFDVLHSSELLLELIEEGKIQLRSLDLAVSWHDPCELGRGAGVYETPRKVIESIPGVRLVELPSSKENSVCCGGGGLLPVTNPQLSSSLAAKRVSEAALTGVSVLVTGCSTCLLNLGGASKKLGGKITVMGIDELIAKALV